MRQEYKIAFCIVCMNRLHQLKETLLRNIIDNAAYPNLQFVLLDYNSADGMGAWVQEELAGYIASGKLVYYRTNEPQEFNHSHSKNLVFNLSDADIVCNVNADHYCGEGFAAYTNEQFNNDAQIVLTTIDFYGTRRDYKPSKDVFGRVCVKKQDFLKVKGFDERMNKYGFEDWDFINRLEFTGIKRVLIDDASYLQFIAHGVEERYSLNDSHIEELYIRHDTASTSELLFLYGNGRYEKGLLIDTFTHGSAAYKYSYQKRGSRFQFAIGEPGWQMGKWNREEGDTVCLAADNGPLLRIAADGREYQQIASVADRKHVLDFYQLYHNRNLMERNLANTTVIANAGDFGKATVYRNFDFNNPITV